MLLLLLLACCVYSPYLFASSLPGMLLGGSRVDSRAFPEILYIEVGHGRCSATVVGPNVILTAAHCVEGTDGEIAPFHHPRTFEVSLPFPMVDPEEDGIETQFHGDGAFTAQCYIHPQYYIRSDYDFALCIATRTFDRYATLAKSGPAVGDRVILAGYGCTRSDGSGGNNGSLRMGPTMVTKVPDKRNRDIWFYTHDSTALCWGDSGGPALHHQSHEVLGVNSRGDIRTLSLLSAVYVYGARQWFREFEGRFDVGICGLSLKCVNGEGHVLKKPRFKGPMRPGTPFPSTVSG